MDEFRKWIDTFIKDKLQNIAQASSLFELDRVKNADYKMQEVEKLLEVVKDYVLSFAQIIV